MKREPTVFAVAGMIFGFVLGYMVASWDSGPRAVSARDPNELKAVESLAARDRSNIAVRVELGNLLMDHSRFDEGARGYREALALDPGQPDEGRSVS